MPSVINTNISSVIAQNNLAKISNALQTNIERLSSGFRVNNAADDAAGFAIANRLDAQVRGMVVASRNANDAISFSQTTSGALSQISNNLQRMCELAIQATNDSNSASDTSLLNQEFNQLQTEVLRVQNSTTFNNVSVFSTTNKIIQIGANTSSNDRINIQGNALNNVKALSRNTITDGTTTSTSQELLAAINSAVATATGSEGKKINDVYNAIVDAINSSQKLSSSSKDSAIDLLGKIKQAYFSAYAQTAYATLTYFAMDATSLLTVNQNPGTYCLVNARSYLTSGFIPDAPSV
jgi:flagellin